MTSTTQTVVRSTSRNPEDHFFGATHFWKGRVALYAILKSLGIGEGDAVLLQGFTCAVVPAAVTYAGARPIYADIDPRTYNAELPQFEQRAAAANAAGARIKAVIVQHTYGIPADIGPIVRWARGRGMAVIEDCCHMIGSRYRDLEDAHTDAWEPLGWQSDAAFYSSHWSKPFTTGIGGWARSGDEPLQARLNEFARRECTSPGALETAALAAQIAVYRALFRPSLFWTAQYVKNRLSRWGLFAGGTQRDPFDRQMPADYRKRMSWLQRALGRREVRRQGRYLEHRRHLRQLYEEALRSAGLPTLDVPNYADPVLLRYPIRVPDKERVLHEARRRRVELDWVDHPLDPPFADMQALGWRDGECPEAEKAAAQVVGLPMHLRVRRGNVRRAVRLLRHFH